MALGSSEEQAGYVQNTLHPVLFDMVFEAIAGMPEDPALFCLEWLVKFLAPPDNLASPILKWARNRRSASREDTECTLGTDASRESSDSDSPMEISASGTVTNPDPTRAPSALKQPGAKRKPEQQTSFTPNTVIRKELAAMINTTKRSSTVEVPADFTARRNSVKIVMTPSSEIQRVLSTVPYVRDLDENDRISVAEIATVRQYDAHSEIIRYGDISSDLYVVMSGTCRVSVPVFKQTLQPGDCFNEAVLLKGEMAAEAMLVASPNTDVQLLSVSAKDLEQLGLKKFGRRPMGTKGSHYITRSDNDAAPQGPPMTRFLSEVEEEVETQAYEASEKSDQDVELIKLAVGRSQLTDVLQLSDEQIHELAISMYRRDFPADTMIIKKGDRGEHFYVVREGVVELISNPDPENPARNVPGTPNVIHFTAGLSFGELALLYNCKRKATLMSKGPCSLYVLDLVGWRNVLAKMPSSRNELYQGMLNSVPEIVAAVTKIEKRASLADCLEEVYYQVGETVVTEGTISYVLYMVLDGSCSVSVNGRKIRKLVKGHYFGEGALFNGTPYPETVTVTSEHATLLQLDRDMCKHLHLNITFEEPNADADKIKTTRRSSLLHMVSTEASTAVLTRLDTKRFEIPMERLEQVGMLGCGSFAQVSLVYDPVTAKLYALKAMSKQSIAKQGQKSMVLGERNALAELGENPFVIRLNTTYRDDRCIYLLLDPALGGELFGLYSDNDWYGSEEKASFYMSCVALGVDHIHSKKIIHRDIKLENILVDERGYALITDLGIGKVVIGKTYTVCGTSDYLAPETLKLQGHNRAVDWWALGILIYAMMAGRMPFDADDVLQIYKNICKGFKKEHFSSVFSVDLVDLIKGLCRKKPQERITMLSGGIANLAKHPWAASKEDPTKWSQISSLSYPAPWEPSTKTVEERRASMKQEVDDDGPTFEEYVDDGTGWDIVF